MRRTYMSLRRCTPTLNVLALTPKGWAWHIPDGRPAHNRSGARRHAAKVIAASGSGSAGWLVDVGAGHFYEDEIAAQRWFLEGIPPSEVLRAGGHYGLGPLSEMRYLLWRRIERAVTADHEAAGRPASRNIVFWTVMSTYIYAIFGAGRWGAKGSSEGRDLDLSGILRPSARLALHVLLDEEDRLPARSGGPRQHPRHWCSLAPWRDGGTLYRYTLDPFDNWLEASAYGVA